MSDGDEHYKRLEAKLDKVMTGLADINVTLGRLDERMSAEREANGRLREEVQKVSSDLWTKINSNHAEATSELGKLKVDIAHTRGRDRVLGGAVVLVLSGLISLVVSFFRGG